MVELQHIESGKVLKNTRVNLDSFEMVIHAPLIARLAKPGQFVMVSCSGVGRSPLLRRPLSIHDVDGDIITLLYRVVGQGTELMSSFNKGDAISVLGPLGVGFKIRSEGSHCMVAGGIGIAPLLFLARTIRHNQPQAEVHLLVGARNKEELLVLEKFSELASVQISTDDGSAGHHGFVTDLLDSISCSGPMAVYTCGPTPMMYGVAKLCKKHGYPCQVSLESHMACGMGACLGCAVERSGIHGGVDRYVHVCKDGPVFEAEEIWA